LTEVAFVLTVDDLIKINNDHGQYIGEEDGFGPLVYKSSMRSPPFAPKEAPPLRTCVFEIFGDCPAIEDNSAIVRNDWHAALIRLR
jgi:hypothetical protein